MGVTACLEPVIAAVVAYFGLGETMGWVQVLGRVLIVAAVIMLQLNPAEEENALSGETSRRTVQEKASEKSINLHVNERGEFDVAYCPG
ncbi:hypothetical protein SAMN05660235_02070 [Sporolituus thermophilus DSM 23256]|uniref:EamA-like transporter family protein n=1 Tax=Sporolituus thermophilus DSM 23256 TaxID=1123285 RepID=A0A1G7MAT8_9FIRM|nr:hypothetical protein [Sporolituus thermophilus]SDF58744.1 hypothetical protein SAMN05660235_02070 [Sporolituus thermophilus DSM 23256]